MLQPDHDRIENLLHNHFKAWAFRVAPTSKKGHTIVYVHEKNVSFAASLLKNAGFKQITIMTLN